MSMPSTTYSARAAGGPSGGVGEEQATATDEVVSLQRVQVAQVPSAIRHAISLLLVGPGLDAQKCERILEQLLHYAGVWQRSMEEGGDVAVISISNLLATHKRDCWTCCCYQTANTFIRLLCALHLLRRHRGPGGTTEYHLPLAEGFTFQPDDDMLATLSKLCDPAQTKNKRVRDKAAEVKSRLLLLCATSSLRDQQHVEAPESTGLVELTDKMRAALAQVDGLLHSVGKLEGSKRKQVMTGIGTVLVELFQEVRLSTTAVDSRSAGWGFAGKGSVDSVDSRRFGSGERHSAQPFQRKQESTKKRDSADIHAQNLPLVGQAVRATGEAEEARRTGEGASENLPTPSQMADSAFPIDNESKRVFNNTLSSSSPPPQNTQSEMSSVIDSSAASRKAKLSVQPGCVKFTMGEARDLARAVEHNRGDNFPAYIALSATCTRQVIRAAVVNMLAHRYFPDRDGSRDADIDGEITGKWGVPRRPGAWVTEEARAYQQSGIPRVMQLLLSCFVSHDARKTPYSYQRIEELLEDLSRRTTSDEFWYGLQVELCNQEGEERGTAGMEVREEGEAGSQITASGGMTADEASLLVERIECEGAPLGIVGRPRVQGSAWVVELLVANGPEGEGTGGVADVFTGVLRTEQEWLDYISLVIELEGN